MSKLAVFLLSLTRGLWERPPVLLVLILNLIPVACVLWFGWSALALLLLYWAENVVLGVIQAIKMLITGVYHGLAGIAACLFMVPFFIIHYGGFCLGHGFFILVIGEGVRVEPSLDAAVALVRADEYSLAWALASLVVLHLGGLVQWVRAGEPRRTELNTLMSEPYGRIIVLHLTIIFGAMLIMMLNQPVAGVALLAVLKTIYETVTTANRLKKQEAAKAAAAAA